MAATRTTHTRATSMPFLDHLIAASSKGVYKKQKRSHHSDSSSDVEMAFFAPSSNQFLQAPSAPSRKRSQRFLKSNNDIEEFLSSDLEISFASNVSLNSPPRENINLSSDCEAMDISPAPAARSANKPQRPRAFTSGARLFGSDLSNSGDSLLPSPHMDAVAAAAKGPVATQSSKRTQRSALPSEWFTVPKQPEATILTAPSSPMDDAMDVDTSYHADSVAQPITFSPPSFSSAVQSAAPTVTGFNQLFYDTLSPRRSYESPSAHPRKRRSLSPESVRNTVSPQHELSSSPMQHSSPSDAKLERITVAGRGKPSLPGLGAPSAGFLKRPRRPVLSAMVQPSDHAIQSAYPIMSPSTAASGSEEDHSPRGSAPVRRAFSAFLPPSIYTEQEDEESFEGPDMSSPAQAYSKRQQVKTIRRCDGTEDFRPLTGATAMISKESPSAKFMAPGMPGFGDNEAHGKILPCHRVSEDGLMRIKPETLDNLLDGHYNDDITDFHIIDCRFDYEYAGGHIPGAVNINNTASVEELLLGPSLTKPKPSVSGDKARKTILVFHCEFSAKRAPTFAKHLRAKDRAMNNQVYPRIHYPEVYVLEGGYCQYFKMSGHRCEPPAYVTMDDPNHASSRREDLDQFRKAKFGRHKSYTYGDGAKALSYAQQQQQQQQPKRNTAPAPPTLFAAATAARSRRGGGGLTTLIEDGSATADETDTDLGDSPCPPPTKSAGLKSKKPIRPMVRSETYGPGRMPFC